MVVDDDDFSDHADRIENDYNDEISRRCVMSRKYYAAFHYVRENGRSHSNSNFSNGGSDHQEAQKFLRSINHGQLAQKLFRLHKWRKEADYDINNNISDSDLQHFKNVYGNFMTNVQYLPQL